MWLSLFEHKFVDVAPHPIFARLLRTDHGMFCGVKMFRGVFVLRRIAAAYVAASQAQAQMDPTVAHLEAFFAAFGLRFDFANLIEVRTAIGHVSLLGFTQCANHIVA